MDNELRNPVLLPGVELDDALPIGSLGMQSVMHYGLHAEAAYWQSVVELNTWQQDRIAQLVVQKLFGTVTGKRIAVLGFAFKADTNDTREAPAIRICKDLLEEGAQLAIYDPKVPALQMAI